MHRSISLLAIAAILAFAAVVACTKSAANTAVTVADVACEIVVKVAGLPDLCATLAEVARAQIALSTMPASTAALGPTMRRAPVTPAELRAEILRAREAR